MDYVDNSLEWIKRLVKTLEDTKARHKEEIKQLKSELNQAAESCLVHASTPDEALEIASQIYWMQEDIPTAVVYEFYGIAPQAVAGMLYKCTMKVACYDCKQSFDQVLNSRSHSQRLRQSGTGVCPSCEAKRNQRWEQYKIEAEAEKAEIQRLKTIPYKEYLQSEHWKETRRQALKRAGFKCQLCNGDGVLDVHHRTYERRGEEKNSDLIVLCRPCHAKFHDKDG